MSDKILLEDDENAMFGDDDEEEEEEDVDMPIVNPVAAVKKEEPPPPPEEQSAQSTAELNGDKVDVKTEEPAGEPTEIADAATDVAVAAAATTPSTSTTALPSIHAASASPLTLLPTALPSTSPFPHHNVGPTSDRLRNAMSRIASNPTRDAEAWQALLTEAQSCYRQLLPSLYKLKSAAGHDAETELLGRKLDWIEACYGAVLHHFPYAVAHYVQLVEILLRLSALTRDEEEQCGPAGAIGMMGGMLGSSGGATAGSALSNPTLTTTDQGVATSPVGLLMTDAVARSGTERQKVYDVKLDKIFQLCLGVKLDGSPAIHGDIAASQSIDAEGAATTAGARTVMGGLCPHSMDLWLLYILKRSWDAARSSAAKVRIPPPPPGFVPGLAQQASVLHQQYEESLRSAYRERKEILRDAMTASYETALERGAGFAQNNHLIWKRYVNYVKSWTDTVDYSTAAMSLMSSLPPGSDANLIHATLPPADPAHDHTSSQKQLTQLRSIYHRGITHPMTGLDQFWQEYESFERTHGEALGSVLVAEWLPRYQHARSIYLERNRVWTVHELKVGRLAVPPVGCEDGGGGGGAGGAAASGGVGLASRGGAGATSALGGDDLGAAGGAGAAGMTGKPTNEAEYLAQLEEERSTLSKWQRRSAYERTNPERLAVSDHAMRVRAGYREEVCAFARHPEVWHGWAMWELLHGGSSAASASAAGASTNSASGANGGGGSAGQGGSSSASAALIAPAKAGDWKSGGNALRAVAVLSLGMESLPDSALLAQAQAEILERHLDGGAGKKDESGIGCIKVLERFVDRAPTTLGFVLLQRLVRRHVSIAAARAVFARARRTLRVRDEDKSFSNEDGSAGASALASAENKGIEDVAGQGAEAKDKADGPGNKGTLTTQQQMVTNRLKASVGSQSAAEVDKVDTPESISKTNSGFITWHLYAAHATIEHRLSKKPQVAARIYELGLRKHRTFLSNPPYVLHYANLLLELNDEENLRSLLMRAVAACEEEEANTTSTAGGGPDAATISTRREMQRPLWDMMLKFESVLSSQGNTSVDILSIESRRRRALYGPLNEDVVTGGDSAPQDDDDNHRNLGSGANRSSLSEQLVRVEGYDVASRIANGMGRMVDVLTVTAAIGNGEASDSGGLDFAAAASASLAAGGSSSGMWGDECAGGPSDVSYVKRLKYQRESRTRAATAALGLGGTSQGGLTDVSGKLLSSRERSTAGGAAAQQQAQALALQNSPEWLRPLLLLLPPVPRFGRAGTVKPPPHLTEMALSALRSNPLPARPTGTKATSDNGKNNASGRKRGRGFHDNGGDSSDEENGNFGGGYSNQFRARQRSRLVGSDGAT
eukprot:CAMPEP_0183710292 /NCGR_PEP_ID=MMETSP0737-20130205/6065_1 /TAXON_ID=385413 /ORGANISM="Thalassiosira miniscula, Strain CCMP1093" /LENGTH=1345 /DNA_ID=CAMNT_0025938531 /DNA_START=78 /DNA_END=4115 /DNA_ORIENTATION=+